MDKYIIFFNSLKSAVYFFVCMFFALKSFESKLRFNKKNSWVIALIYTVISLIISQLFLEDYSVFAEYKGVTSIIWLATSFAFAFLCIKVNLLQLLFFIFLMINIQTNIVFISKAIYQLNIFPNIVGLESAIYALIGLIVLLLFLPYMIYLYTGLLKRVVDMNLTSNYWRWLFVLPCSYYMLYWLLSKNLMSPNMSPLSSLILLVILNICVQLSYVAILKMQIRTSESLTASQQVKISEKIVMMQKEQYYQIADHVEKTSRLRHDFRHHLIAINDYANKNDLEGLRHYLYLYQKESISEDETSVCENYLVDVILRHYMARAKKQGIDVRISVGFSKDFCRPDTELCVIFGNLFENALESCQRQIDGHKFIEIKAKSISKSMLAITVTNSYDGVIKKRGDAFISSKHESFGIGVSTISSIAEKNGGSCKFSFENNVFRAHVLLVE